MDGQMDGRMDGQTETYRQTDRQMDGRMNKSPLVFYRTLSPWELIFFLYFFSLNVSNAVNIFRV